MTQRTFKNKSAFLRLEWGPGSAPATPIYAERDDWVGDEYVTIKVYPPQRYEQRHYAKFTAPSWRRADVARDAF